MTVFVILCASLLFVRDESPMWQGQEAAFRFTRNTIMFQVDTVRLMDRIGLGFESLELCEGGDTVPGS